MSMVTSNRLLPLLAGSVVLDGGAGCREVLLAG
jgi:hypothetical protein